MARSPSPAAAAIPHLAALSKSARARADETDLAHVCALQNLFGAVDLELCALRARLETAENEIAMLAILAK